MGSLSFSWKRLRIPFPLELVLAIGPDHIKEVVSRLVISAEKKDPPKLKLQVLLSTFPPNVNFDDDRNSRENSTSNQINLIKFVKVQEIGDFLPILHSVAHFRQSGRKYTLGGTKTYIMGSKSNVFSYQLSLHFLSKFITKIFKFFFKRSKT